ncbi:MAG: hypothetical protein ACI4P4_13545 [Faecousia sp.]
MKKILALLLAAVMVIGLLAGCGPQVTIPSQTEAPVTEASKTDNTAPEATEAPKELTFAQGTVLRMATGYNSTKTGLFFDAEVAGDGVTLADGKTYHAGDLKPTWVEVQNRLGMVFEDKYQGNSASKEFDYWKEQLDQVDMVSGTAAKLSEFGVAGSLVNIADYLDMMPNFKAYLDANPIIRMTITGDTSTGAIYISPYFDGVSDIERMPLMRTDWVEKLLDGDGEFAADACGKTAKPVYEPYMPTSGKVTVDVVKADGSGVETVTKDYDTAGNIVAKMNEAGSLSGVDAVNMLRTYIDEAYAGYYGTNRSDLFVGQNAAWDADELVALLRCVVANAKTLNGTDTVQGLFSREDNNTQRRVDMYRFAGTLFGVRGLESRKDFLYVDSDGMLHDARQEPATYEALDRMNAMVAEGLISKAFVDSAEEKTQTYLENDLGFMHYDYNQTQTIYNEDGKTLDTEAGEKYMAAMVPVARWYDGTDPNGVYMRFTESWRSVKTDGWGISKAGVGDDQDKLYACLKLIDYAYSEEGQILMSYGPDAFIGDGTFMFNGKEMPVIADATRAELWAKAKGNYTNYARQYLGSTLSFLKSQAFEYQCTTEVGRIGAGYISTAIGLGTIHHPELAVTDNMWYTSVPTILPTTTVENDQINGMTNLGNDKFGQSKDQNNILVNIIVGGYSEEGMSDAASAAGVVTSDWSGAQYLQLQNDAWDRALDFYNTIH